MGSNGNAYYSPRRLAPEEMTYPMLYVVSSLIYLWCQLLPVESQTITVNPIGDWTEGEAVTLTCTISSYSGQMRWLLGSTDVASCNPDTCNQISTGDGAYVFGFDTTYHIFLWTINPVKKSNNGNIFKCSDGTSTANFTATVKDKATTTTTAEPSNSGLSIAALCLSITVLVVLALFIVYICCCNSARRGNANVSTNANAPTEEMQNALKRKIETQLNEGKQEMQNALKKMIETQLNDGKQEMQNALKRMTETQLNNGKQEMQNALKKMIETQLNDGKQEMQNALKKMIETKLNDVRQEMLIALKKMIETQLNDGKFLKLPLLNSQLKIIIGEGIKSWIEGQNTDVQATDPITLTEKQKSDVPTFDPETALVGDDETELDGALDQSTNHTDDTAKQGHYENGSHAHGSKKVTHISGKNALDNTHHKIPVNKLK